MTPARITPSTPSTPARGPAGVRHATGRVGLLAALTATVLGCTALAAAPAAPAGFGGGRFMAAAAPVLASGQGGTGDDRADGEHGRHRTATVRTSARARAQRDGRDRRDTAWRVARVSAEGLVARNRATATAAGCTGCDAVAVSVQVVVDSRSTGAVDATNRAVAVTSACSHCSATALAYQFVVAGPGRLRLTDAASAELRSLRRQMREVARHAAPADVTAREDALAARITDVLRSGVVVVGGAASSGPEASYHRVGGAGAAPGVRVTVHRAHDRA